MNLIKWNYWLKYVKRKKNRSNRRRAKVGDKSCWNYNEESRYASIKKKEQE